MYQLPSQFFTNLHQQLLLVIFLRKKDGAEYLKLFNTWWILSNSKDQFSNHNLGHAAKKGDGNPEFCRTIADCIENWCNESVSY